MTGGLMQLVGKGAQDYLVIGNPTFTHFRSVYKKHSDFAMEHFRLVFKTNNLNLPTSGSLTLRAKVERYAQLLHDCYLTVTLPDIYSPVVPYSGTSPNINSNANAVPYEFQWVRNIGYNMINYVAIVINGQEIVRHTGEYMKLYAAMKFDANKKAILDRMVGNVPEVYDPANAYDRINQYPHAISSSSAYSLPSIPGRILHVPLHFWFCENIGAALPLVALQLSEVEIVVELKNMYQLFTTLDVRPTLNGTANPNFNRRVAPDSSDTNFYINNFLSPPLYTRTPSFPAPVVNPSLMSWNLNPFIEANFIFLTDTELAHVAKNEAAFMVNQVDIVRKEGQYGASNDLELTMRNLCTRIIWVQQRSDVALNNDYDNYTNWLNPYQPPATYITSNMTPWYSPGLVTTSNVPQRDILLDSSIILDGKERFNTKDGNFFGDLQFYKHYTGTSSSTIPGMNSYSFALDNDNIQPSGHINGSMFNKTILRNSYVQPPFVSSTNPTTVCILKSTALSLNPVIIPNPNITDPTTGRLIYNPEDVVTVVTKSNGQTYDYTFNVTAFVETYNFLRVMGGIANIVFSS